MYTLALCTLYQISEPFESTRLAFLLSLHPFVSAERVQSLRNEGIGYSSEDNEMHQQ